MNEAIHLTDNVLGQKGRLLCRAVGPLCNNDSAGFIFPSILSFVTPSCAFLCCHPREGGGPEGGAVGEMGQVEEGKKMDATCAKMTRERRAGMTIN